MSRIGREPVVIPAGVQIEVKDGNVITVKGPLGELTRSFSPKMEIKHEDGKILVLRPDDERETRSIHGLTRSLIYNMVQGVTEGFKKTLLISGTGYRAEKKGDELVMKLGFSHDIIVKETDIIKIDVPDPTRVIIKGSDKELVGQFAADVRGHRPPEPYKGKGIRYADEYVRRKAGKTGA
ncbi:MAG: 50S ribosomal protein L6 [Candidatus Scatomorpha sp.]|jgi:large subunit ribosomal protein L6